MDQQKEYYTALLHKTHTKVNTIEKYVPSAINSAYFMGNDYNYCICGGQHLL